MLRLLPLLAAVTACTASDPVALEEPEETSDAVPTQPTGGEVDFDPPENGIQLTIGPFELPAYSEQYYCKITHLPNTEPLDIVALEHQGSATLHHFNIWGLAYGPEEEVEGPCDELWAQTNMALSSPLYASQDPTFYGEFPEGVAGLMPAGQPVLLEYHAVNAFGAPTWTEAKLNAYAAEPGTVEHYANGLFGSNTDIDIPPHTEATLSQKCFVDVDMDVFVIGSHFHSRGTLFEVYAMDAEGNTGELLYDNDDWAAPELLITEPFHVPAGTGFEFRCHYDNDTDAHVGYGDSSDDEMCMFAALYYPDKGFQWCSSSP